MPDTPIREPRRYDDVYVCLSRDERIMRVMRAMMPNVGFFFFYACRLRYATVADVQRHFFFHASPPMF